MFYFDNGKLVFESDILNDLRDNKENLTPELVEQIKEREYGLKFIYEPISEEFVRNRLNISQIAKLQPFVRSPYLLLNQLGTLITPECLGEFEKEVMKNVKVFQKGTDITNKIGELRLTSEVAVAGLHLNFLFFASGLLALTNYNTSLQQELSEILSSLNGAKTSTTSVSDAKI